MKVSQIAMTVVFAIVLSGCGSLSFTSTRYQVTKKAPANEVVQLVEKELLPPETATTYVSDKAVPVQPLTIQKVRHGRFIIEKNVNTPGYTVVGGEFTPGKYLPQETKAAYAIFVDLTMKELTAYRRKLDGSYEPLIGFAIVSIDADSLPYEVVRGMVQRINTAPTWCPTDNMRRADPTLPKGCVPFGHPDNAMGVAKFEIEWQVEKRLKSDWQYRRLHGTKGYHKDNFWDSETYGCVGLMNESMLKLVRILGPDAEKEGVEVVLFRGNPLLLKAL